MGPRGGKDLDMQVPAGAYLELRRWIVLQHGTH
jgi:hypothetical protein